MPSAAAMLGTTTPTPDVQMLQALLASSLAGQQAMASSEQTYQIRCNATEYAQLQAATLAQRTTADPVKAETMAVTVAKLVRETVDAKYAEAQKTAKELKQVVRGSIDDTSSSEQDTPAKTTPRRRNRANKKQRLTLSLAAKDKELADLALRLKEAEETVADQTPEDALKRGSKRLFVIYLKLLVVNHQMVKKIF